MTHKKEDAKKYASQLEHIFNNVPRIYEMNEEYIHQCDKESGDLQHFIELTSFNASEGYKLAKELKENRTRRRECKDQNMLLKPLYDLVKKHHHILKDIRKCISDIQKVENTMDNRTYTPRVRTEMQEAFQKASGT